MSLMYREGFSLLSGSAVVRLMPTCAQAATTNFIDESACLTADDVRNEVVTIHRSPEMLKVLSLCHLEW
jgi:hypothetical protein